MAPRIHRNPGGRGECRLGVDRSSWGNLVSERGIHASRRGCLSLRSAVRASVRGEGGPQRGPPHGSPQNERGSLRTDDLRPGVQGDQRGVDRALRGILMRLRGIQGVRPRRGEPRPVRGGPRGNREGRHGWCGALLRRRFAPGLAVRAGRGARRCRGESRTAARERVTPRRARPLPRLAASGVPWKSLARRDLHASPLTMRHYCMA
jgi:hypothetical protein